MPTAKNCGGWGRAPYLKKSYYLKLIFCHVLRKKNIKKKGIIMLGKRVLLKISGEALAGNNEYGFDAAFLDYLCEEIKSVYGKVELALVVGAGNIYRGASGGLEQYIARTTGDSMGMLATCINALAVRDYLVSHDIDSEILGAFAVDSMFDHFTAVKAKKILSKNKVLIITGGTSNPFFTTDTAAVLRALEIEASVVLKATNVDGVYDKDPNKHEDAVKYDELTFEKAIEKQLKVMDITSFSMAMDNNIDIRVFDLHTKGNTYKAIIEQSVGSLVTS